MQLKKLVIPLPYIHIFFTTFLFTEAFLPFYWRMQNQLLYTYGKTNVKTSLGGHTYIHLILLFWLIVGLICKKHNLTKCKTYKYIFILNNLMVMSLISKKSSYKEWIGNIINSKSCPTNKKLRLRPPRFQNYQLNQSLGNIEYYFIKNSNSIWKVNERGISAE